MLDWSATEIDVLTSFAQGKVFGARSGAGAPTVVALHGWRGSHDQVAAIVDGFDAIALDLPGFGASPLPPEAWGAAEYADLVATVIREVRDGSPVPVVVVGYSFGGRVAVNLAARHPQLVKALVLTGAPLIRQPGSGRPPLAFRLLKAAHRLGVVPDARMERERRRRGSSDYRAAEGLLRDIFVRVVNESYEDALAAVRCPVEMVWGDADTEAPLGQARQAQELLADARMDVVAGGTHWSLVSRPGEVRAAIERVLA